MALPDPHADEPVVELDPDKVKRYRHARDAVKRWSEELVQAKAALMEDLRDAYAGTVNGKKVVGYRPQSRFAEARLVKDHPDLTQHYITPKVQDTFDVDAFAAHHPDIADQYRIRAFVELG